MGTRDRILESAVELARDGGVRSVSVRAVASAAGVGPTTLRYYFPTQAALQQAIAERLVLTALDDRDIADDHQPAAQRLFDCVVQFLPADDADVAALDVWLELYRLSSGPSRSEPTGQLVSQSRRVSKQVLRDWLATLSDQGHLDSDRIDTHVVQLLALIDGIHLSLLLDRGSFRLEDARQTVRWYIDHALTA